MDDVIQKVEDMKKYLETLGLYGRLQATFLGAYTAYLKSTKGCN
jgi:hypothetical protein